MALTDSAMGNKYFSSWGDAMYSIFGPVMFKGGTIGRLVQNDLAAYNKDRELQKKEFEALGLKTVNYGSAITNPADVSGEVTTEEQQAASLAALEEENELLGKRLNTLGSTSLVGLK